MKTYYTDLFDIFDSFFAPDTAANNGVMRTDISEDGDEYRLDIEAPGYTKDDIALKLDEGYLTVTCSRKREENRKYLRQELMETSKRVYFVGKDVTPELVKAKYENGILSLTFPKSAPKLESKTIAIE